MTQISNTHSNNRWLLDHAADITSQGGEDGTLEVILNKIGVSNGWCVEFGAWDGKHMSNTYNLIVNKGYSAVLIEGDKKRTEDLKRTYDGVDRVTPINAFVGFEKNTLDEILSTTGIPADFDLLSIDIDGNDYHVWSSVVKYVPKVVIIEYNSTIPTEVDFVQERDFGVSQGCSLAALKRLGTQKGYELVCVTRNNAIFVRQNYFDQFGIADNSAYALRADNSHVTYLFVGFDGKVIATGFKRSPWHHVSFSKRRLQQVPLLLRTFPDNYNPMQKAIWYMFRVWAKLTR